MNKVEERATIDAACGQPSFLQDLRATLPVAHTRRHVSAANLEPVAARRRRRGAGVAAGAGDSAAAALAGAFTPQQRETLIDQALLMLETVYAHLPLKRALHAIDPIQRLQLLRLQHQPLDEREFQSKMIEIFVGLRDLHTYYTLPRLYWSKFAFLPFRVEEYYVARERRYLVSRVSPVNTDSKLKPGTQITHWNGTPIDLAVARNAVREAGSNAEARRARGLEALTLRWLGASLPPDEDWVTLTFAVGSKTVESRFHWQVLDREDLLPLLPSADNGSDDRATGLGIDVKTELLRRVRKAIFDAPALKADEEMARHRASGTDAAPRADISVMPDVYPRFGSVTTPSGTFGYIRVATFLAPDRDVDGAVAEFARLLRAVPQNGLILDVRGNAGGHINFGEGLLQMLTPRSITPEPFHFVTTPFTLQIARAEWWLGKWKEPLATALATGASFSQGFPLTDPAACNNIGQIYQGPVVLITDAFCYSTTDIFTAGFQDHEIGTILGCHDNTGAGGANVWGYADVLQHLAVKPNPFHDLPGGAEFRVAARRSTRIGDRSGVPLEDLGVVPDERYFMSEADLLSHNVDLIARAAQILAGRPNQRLKVMPETAAPVVRLQVESKNIDRVDLLCGDRPLMSQDITAGSLTMMLPNPIAAGGMLTARGYRAGKLVASARLQVS